MNPSSNISNITGHVVDDYELLYLYWIPQFYKTLFKDAFLFPKMYYKANINTPREKFNCCKGEAPYVLCVCICHESNVDSQTLKRTTRKLKISISSLKLNASKPMILERFLQPHLSPNILCDLL
jgi:hypothetical protein